jgi:hypothetical protein
MALRLYIPPVHAPQLRYIFLLFEQVGGVSPDLGGVSLERKQWNASSYLKNNAGKLRPRGFFFFYCSK